MAVSMKKKHIFFRFNIMFILFLKLSNILTLHPSVNSKKRFNIKYISDGEDHLEVHMSVHKSGDQLSSAKQYDQQHVTLPKSSDYNNTDEQHGKEHNPDKEYPCNYCDKRFGMKRNLYRHMLVHGIRFKKKKKEHTGMID